MAEMPWYKRSCKLSWWCAADESKCKTQERCKPKHVDEAGLLLPDTPVHLGNALRQAHRLSGQGKSVVRPGTVRKPATSTKKPVKKPEK